MKSNLQSYSKIRIDIIHTVGETITTMPSHSLVYIINNLLYRVQWQSMPI